MSPWLESVDFYCERLDPSFWAEPWNALSNLSFLIAGGLSLYRFSRTPGTPRAVWLLGWNVVLVGIGSFGFHTMGTRLAQLGDLLPIFIFMVFYLGYALRTVFNVAWGPIFAGLTVFFALTIGFEFTPLKGVLNGSLMYIPSLFALAGFAGAARARPEVSRNFALAAMIFGVDVLLRSIDQAVCPFFPWGTHFLWHTGNGLLLWWLLRIIS